MDCTSCWYRAEVLNVVRDKREVLVHFVGYDTRFDQVMSFDSPLIRPAGRLEALARTLRKIDRGTFCYSQKNAISAKEGCSMVYCGI